MGNLAGVLHLVGNVKNTICSKRVSVKGWKDNCGTSSLAVLCSSALGGGMGGETGKEKGAGETWHDVRGGEVCSGWLQVYINKCWKLPWEMQTFREVGWTGAALWFGGSQQLFLRLFSMHQN